MNGGVGPVIAEAALTVAGGEGLLEEELLAPAGHVAGDLAGGVPPPAPVHVVDLCVQARGVQALALGVDGGHLELVRLAGADVAAAPAVLVQFGLDADVGAERGHPDAVVGGATSASDTLKELEDKINQLAMS